MKKLSDNQTKYNLLGDILRHLKNDFNLTPRVGVELEFHIHDIANLDSLEKIINQSIKFERGHNQYEIDFPPSTEIIEYTKFIENIRNQVIQGAKKLGGMADFSSKPFANDFGNSMHVHLDFLEDNDTEKFAKILCHYLDEDISIFLPKEEDKLRLDKNFMSPTHICYGGNNRTVAIRIPDSIPKRLEHRLPAASADPACVMHAILLSIYNGLMNPKLIKPYQKIYGNAFDKQYNLEKILP